MWYQKKTLTIAIPAFNAGKTINATLQSIDYQKNKDLVVMVVDDGSTDNTKKVVEPWVRKYPGIIKYYYQKNGNWGSVMNFALKKFNSRYFRTLDSDDTFNTESFNRFMEILRNVKGDIDLILTNYTFKFDSTGKSENKCVSNSSSLLEYFFFDEWKTNKIVSVHSCTISRNIAKKFVPLPTKCYYTDNFYIYQIFLHAQSVAMLNKDIYVYEYHVGDTGQSININNCIKHLDDLLKVYNAVINLPIPAHFSRKRRLLLARQIKIVFYWALLIIAIDKSKSIEQKKANLNTIIESLQKVQDTKLFGAALRTADLALFKNFSSSFIISVTSVVYKIVWWGFIGATKPYIPDTKK